MLICWLKKIDRYTRTNNVEFNIACKYIIEVVKEQPTAFDVEKVVKQLEKESYYTDIETDREVVDLNEAIEIIKAGEI